VGRFKEGEGRVDEAYLSNVFWLGGRFNSLSSKIEDPASEVSIRRRKKRYEISLTSNRKCFASMEWEKLWTFGPI
jgi:hypothetical protein